MKPTADADITNNTKANQYELSVDGAVVGTLTYQIKGDTITFVSTEVKPEFENHGYAARLVAVGLDEARDTNQIVVPQCPYVAVYIKRHQEYADLLE